MSTDGKSGSPPYTAAEIASIETGVYAGNTVPLRLERAIREAAGGNTFVELDINGVPMLVGPDSILGDIHTEGSLMHTYERASRASRKGDANPSGELMEDIVRKTPEWKEREALRQGKDSLPGPEMAIRAMDDLTEKLEKCQLSPVFMAGWLAEATKLTTLGAKLDVERVSDALTTALEAEWSHASGVSQGLWNRTRNVVKEADMQLRTYGQIFELDYSAINIRTTDSQNRGRNR